MDYKVIEAQAMKEKEDERIKNLLKSFNTYKEDMNDREKLILDNQGKDQIKIDNKIDDLEDKIEVKLSSKIIKQIRY